MAAAYPKSKFAVIQADVGQKSACERLVSEAITQLGGLDIIISNAGIYRSLPFTDLRMDTILSV